MNRSNFPASRLRLRTAWTAALLLAVAGLVPRPLFAQSAPAVPAASALSVAADSTSDLAPTTAPPWNPARPAGAHEPWEVILDAPLTLASLPLQLVGAGLRLGLLHVQEDVGIPRIRTLLAFDLPWGFGLRTADLGDRTGTGGSIVLVPPVLHGWVRAEAQGSTLRYSRARLEVGPSWVFARYTHDWRPQEPFFGVGMDSRENDASNYSMRSRRAELRMNLRQAGATRREWTTWIGERRLVTRRGRDTRRSSLEVVFPGLASQVFDVEQDQVVAGARLALDARAGRPHWSRGWRLAGQAERFDHPWSNRGIVFAGRATSPAFDRATLEGETGFSFMRDPRTVRLSARVVDMHVARGTEPPALYDLATLGGGAGLRGFEPGRFHGTDLAVARLAYVFPLSLHSEFEIFSELGGVYENVWRDARLDRADASYGVSLRLRTMKFPVGAAGLSWSRETVRFGFSLGGVE